MPRFLPEGVWTDVDPIPSSLITIYSILHPNRLVRAALVNVDVAATHMHSVTLNLAGREFIQPPLRRMIYQPPGSTSRYMVTLRLHRQPTAAVDLTLGTKSVSAAGVVTYTSSVEGKLITMTGVLAATGSAPHAAEDISGMLLPKYQTEISGDPRSEEQTTVVTASAGDVFWVIAQGDVELLADANATTDESPMMTSNGVDGAAENSSAFDGTTTTTALNTSLLRNPMSPKGGFIGYWKESTAGGAVADAWLMLPLDVPRTWLS